MNDPDKQLSEVTKQVSEAFDIFKLIVANLKSFKSKIDEIIIEYYQFLKEVAKFLEKYYRGKTASE